MSSRRLLRRFLRPFVNDEFFSETIRPADRRIDAALDQLESEEPSLLEFLSHDEGIQKLLDAHSAATAFALSQGLQVKMPFEQIIKRLDQLTYRVLATVAVEATARARRENREFMKGFGNDD